LSLASLSSLVQYFQLSPELIEVEHLIVAFL
jgi:hypothetical protein